jgi:hypothetical protein
LNFYILNKALEAFLQDRSDKRKLDTFRSMKYELFVIEKEYRDGFCKNREVLEDALDVINNIYSFLNQLKIVSDREIREEISRLADENCI